MERATTAATTAAGTVVIGNSNYNGTPLAVALVGATRIRWTVNLAVDFVIPGQAGETTAFVVVDIVAQDSSKAAEKCMACKSFARAFVIIIIGTQPTTQTLRHLDDLKTHLCVHRGSLAVCFPPCQRLITYVYRAGMVSPVLVPVGDVTQAVEAMLSLAATTRTQAPMTPHTDGNDATPLCIAALEAIPEASLTHDEATKLLTSLGTLETVAQAGEPLLRHVGLSPMQAKALALFFD